MTDFEQRRIFNNEYWTMNFEQQIFDDEWPESWCWCGHYFEIISLITTNFERWILNKGCLMNYDKQTNTKWAQKTNLIKIANKKFYQIFLAISNFEAFWFSENGNGINSGNDNQVTSFLMLLRLPNFEQQIRIMTN